MRKVNKVDGLRSSRAEREEGSKFTKFLAISGYLIIFGAVCAGVGAYEGYHYANGQADSTQKAIQAALKAVPVASAASKVSGR